MTERPISGGARQAAGVEVPHGIDREPVAPIPDLVQITTEESFPASDAPGWSGLSIGPSNPSQSVAPRASDTGVRSETTVERIAREVQEESLVWELNGDLAVLLDLGASYRHAHWNVRGPGFPTLHALFRAFADEVTDATEALAERAVTLGGRAEGTVHATTARSHLPPLPVDAVTADELVPALRERAMHVSDLLRAEVARSTYDQVTRQVQVVALHAIERQLSLLSGRLLSAADPAI